MKIFRIEVFHLIKFISKYFILFSTVVNVNVLEFIFELFILKYILRFILRHTTGFMCWLGMLESSFARSLLRYFVAYLGPSYTSDHIISGNGVFNLSFILLRLTSLAYFLFTRIIKGIILLNYKKNRFFWVINLKN